MDLRSRVLKAAEALFRKSGLHFTLQEVAAALHISKKPSIRSIPPRKSCCWTWWMPCSPTFIGKRMG